MKATHAALPGSRWALWRQVMLRAPGFPAAGVTLLASPALAEEADDLPDPEPAGQDGRWARYLAVFEAAESELSAQVSRLAGDERFGLAIAWQNHQALHTAIVPMARASGPDRVRRNSKRRQREELLANYWQRYCTKNDTIGFFGPAGWAQLDPEVTATELYPGPELVASSDMFFEAWAIDRLAESIAAEPGMTAWLRPRRYPFVRLDGCCATGADRVPVELTEAEAAVLQRCTGLAAARDIARELAGRWPEAAADEEIHEIIGRLHTRGLLSWKLEPPMHQRPERYLRRFLEQVGDPALSASGLAQLGRLEAARDAAWTAAHGDLPGFVSAVQYLDTVFGEVAGAPPSRHGGRSYGARTLAYHDARRDVRLVLGADFLGAAEPLDMLLVSARWLTYHLGARVTEVIGAAVDRRAGAPVDLASLWLECAPAVYRSAPAMVRELQHEARRRWTAILDVPRGVPQARLDGAAVRERARAAFAAPHAGWSAARYCTVDLLIAASGVDAINRGDFELVLGEVHLAIISIRHAAFVAQHSRPGALLDCVTADFPGPRLLPVLPKENGERLTGRTQPGLTRDEDFLVELVEQTADPARPRLLRAADLTVTPGPDGPVVIVPGDSGMLSFPVIDVFAELLTYFVIDSFPLLPQQPHQPRITVDRLVLTRETWRFQPAQIGFAQLTGEPARFAAARRWRREHGLPRHVFVKVPGEVKPFFVDFDSILAVNLLAKSVRRMQAEAPKLPASAEPQDRVQISEVLPALDQLWLADSADDRYTSELRIVAVDQQGPA